MQWRRHFEHTFAVSHRRLSLSQWQWLSAVMSCHGDRQARENRQSPPPSRGRGSGAVRRWSVSFYRSFLPQSANLPTGLYILPSAISFLKDRSETNYLRSTGPIVTFFSPYGRYFVVDDRYGPLSDFSRVVAMTTICGRNWQNDLHSAGWRSKTDWNMTVYRFKKCSSAIFAYILCKFGEDQPSNPTVRLQAEIFVIAYSHVVYTLITLAVGIRRPL